MINELEKKSSFNAMSDLEITKNSVEMLRYRNNTLAYALGLCGVAASLFAAFICMNSMNPSNFSVIFKIILNVFILLFGFLCCEKAKTYQVRGSFYLIGLGVICLLRILWIPLQLITKYNDWLAATEAGDIAAQQTAEQFLGATVVNSNQVAWLPNGGDVRGFIAIGLLVLAGIFMIVGGVLGFMKAKKLAAYLDSLKETK
ncbi:MAG: hypothetical protein K6B64_04685 [Acholeplasmatales bacterium]|nr:hypothetical protein [Acholeplasmatales bacterium]